MWSDSHWNYPNSHIISYPFPSFPWLHSGGLKKKFWHMLPLHCLEFYIWYSTLLCLEFYIWYSTLLIRLIKDLIFIRWVQCESTGCWRHFIAEPLCFPTYSHHLFILSSLIRGLTLLRVECNWELMQPMCYPNKSERSLKKKKKSSHTFSSFNILYLPL